MHLFKKNTFVHERIIKYSCFMKMKNINCIRSQYINTFKWRLVAEFAESVIVKHKYIVKYALKMNSIWKCKSTVELFTIVCHKIKLNNYLKIHSESSTR